MQKERALVGVCRPPPGQREREDAKGVGTGRRVQSVVQKSKVLTHGKQNALFCHSAAHAPVAQPRSAHALGHAPPRQRPVPSSSAPHQERARALE